MPLIPWRPYRLMRDLEKKIDDLFDEMILQPWGCLSHEQEWQPDIDLYETDDAYLLEADLPGVLPKNVEVIVEDQWVTIRGTRQSAGVKESAQGMVLERRHGSFSRRLHLEKPVDSAQAESKYEEGIYKVRLPKKKD